jgi:hypothetical protein
VNTPGAVVHRLHDAPAGHDPQAVCPDGERQVERRDRDLGDLVHVLAAGHAGWQDRELGGAGPGQQVPGRAEMVRQPAGHGSQQRVSGLVAEAVADRGEPVHREQAQGSLRRALGFGQVRAVATLQPRSAAIAVLGAPPAAASTILARSTSRCGLVAARTICSSLRRRFLFTPDHRRAGPARHNPASSHDQTR